MENDYTKRPGAESDQLCSCSGARLSGKPHHPKTISPKHGILPLDIYLSQEVLFKPLLKCRCLVYISFLDSFFTKEVRQKDRMRSGSRGNFHAPLGGQGTKCPEVNGKQEWAGRREVVPTSCRVRGCQPMSGRRPPTWDTLEVASLEPVPAEPS